MFQIQSRLWALDLSVAISHLQIVRLNSMVGSDLQVSCKATNTRSNFRLVSRISKGLETMIRGPVPNPNSVRVQNPPHSGGSATDIFSDRCNPELTLQYLDQPYLRIIKVDANIQKISEDRNQPSCTWRDPSVKFYCVSKIASCGKSYCPVKSLRPGDGAARQLRFRSCSKQLWVLFFSFFFFFCCKLHENKFYF